MATGSSWPPTATWSCTGPPTPGPGRHSAIRRWPPASTPASATRKVTMIRNVVMVRLKPGHDAARVAEIQDGFRRLDCPGTLSYTIGDDLGLREGTWSFAIVSDFTDVDAYRGYDRDKRHNELRAEPASSAEQVARTQFQLPD